MVEHNKIAELWLIVLEMLFGAILSIFFIKITLFGNYSLGTNIVIGIINFYILLSLLFFFAVFSIGIIGAIRLGQSNRIQKAILYSLAFWFISLIISIGLINIPFLPIYIILIGIVTGFNIGLRKN